MCEKDKLLVTSYFSFSHNVLYLIWDFLFLLKVALQILGQKFYKNTVKSSLYFQSLLILIRKTPVVESHRTTREIRDLLKPRLNPRETWSIFT